MFGLRDRGRISPGYRADLVVFDPATDRLRARHAGQRPARRTARLTAGSIGVVRVLVNGVETVVDGAATGARPGTVLHSGRDTYTVLAGG